MKHGVLRRVGGIMMLLACAYIIYLARNSPVPADQDVTSIFVLFPLGLHLLFSKRKEVVDYEI